MGCTVKHEGQSFMHTPTAAWEHRLSSCFTLCYLILIQSMLSESKDMWGSLLKEYMNLVSFVS